MKTLDVLLVEDDLLIGPLLADMLKNMGYDVCAITTTAPDAVTAAAHYHTGLVIADLHLGATNGIDAIDAILRTGYVHHLFMTGNIAKARAMRPAAVVLEKPFREAALARAIQQALNIAAPPALAARA